MMTNLSEKESKQILANNYLGNIAYISGESPYMVPMTYYFDGDQTFIQMGSSNKIYLGGDLINSAGTEYFF